MPDRSFLPEDYLEKRLQWRTNIISLTLFVVVMGAVVAASYVTDNQRTEVRRLQQQVNKQFEDAAKRLEQLETLQQRKEQMMHKAQVTASLLERVPRTLLLSELVNSMPLSLSLTDMSLDTRVQRNNATRRPAPSALDKAKQAGLAKKGAEPIAEVPQTEVLLQLSGLAPTDLEVSQFMTSLGRCDLFRDVNLAFSEQVMIDEQAMRRFRVDLSLNQDLDLEKFEPTLVRRESPRNPLGGQVELRPDGRTATPRADLLNVRPVSD